MSEVFDFLISALPWIVIGLFVACACVTFHEIENSIRAEKPEKQFWI